MDSYSHIPRKQCVVPNLSQRHFDTQNREGMDWITDLLILYFYITLSPIVPCIKMPFLVPLPHFQLAFLLSMMLVILLLIIFNSIFDPLPSNTQHVLFTLSALEYCSLSGEESYCSSDILLAFSLFVDLVYDIFDVFLFLLVLAFWSSSAGIPSAPHAFLLGNFFITSWIFFLCDFIYFYVGCVIRSSIRQCFKPLICVYFLDKLCPIF